MDYLYFITIEKFHSVIDIVFISITLELSYFLVIFYKIHKINAANFYTAVVFAVLIYLILILCLNSYLITATTENSFSYYSVSELYLMCQLWNKSQCIFFYFYIRINYIYFKIQYTFNIFINVVVNFPTIGIII